MSSQKWLNFGLLVLALVIGAFFPTWRSGQVDYGQTVLGRSQVFAELGPLETPEKTFRKIATREDSGLAWLDLAAHQLESSGPVQLDGLVDVIHLVMGHSPETFDFTANLVWSG